MGEKGDSGLSGQREGRQTLGGGDGADPNFLLQPSRLLFYTSITHGASEAFLLGISLLVSLEVRESLMLMKGSSAFLTPTLSEHQNKHRLIGHHPVTEMAQSRALRFS